jgi:hypothetical protein
MKFCLSFIFSILVIIGYTQQNSNNVKNTQQRDASSFMNLIEKGDTSTAFKQLDNPYYYKKKATLKKFISLFTNDFKKLPVDTKRYVTLVFPSGFNLFRYRYIDSTGVILQVDVSYKTADVNSKIVELGLIGTKALKKERKDHKAAGYDYN